MSTSRPFGTPFCDAVRYYLKQNNLKSLGQINAEILADLAQKFYDHHEAQTKQRKKRGDATAEEIAIYEAYPRKVGKADAIIAIRKACEKSTREAVLGATQRYAASVARWPRSYRFHEERDTVPFPATWFNRESYLDDPKEWLPAGMFARDDDRSSAPGGSPTLQTLGEPQNWKETCQGTELEWCARRKWGDLHQVYQKQLAKLCQPAS